MEKLVKKNKSKIKKMSKKNEPLSTVRHGVFSENKNIPTVFALAIIIVVAVSFAGWIWIVEKKITPNARGNVTWQNDEGGQKRKENDGAKADANNGAIYENKELGFGLVLPKDERRYAYKEIAPKSMNRAVLFGLPINDSEIKKIKKENYSEIFRIELVPMENVGKKTCANKSRQFPLCDNDDRELGRNSQFVFVYTRYDRLDAVEKSKTKLIPADFDATIFTQADEIAKSFRLLSS